MLIATNPKFYWLRWIAVLPAAVVAYFVVYYLFWFFAYVASFFSDQTWWDWIFKTTLGTGVGGAAFVFIGAAVAPLHQKYVAFALMIIVILICGFTTFALIFAPNTHWESWLQVIAQLVGAIIAYFQIIQAESEIASRGETSF